MSIKRRFEQITVGAAFTAHVQPLGGSDLAHLQRAMAEIAPDWSVSLEGICSEQATLVMVPDDGDDATGPSFVIGRETYGLRVDQLHWDTLTEVGMFASLNDVIQALQVRLSFCSTDFAPASVTIH